MPFAAEPVPILAASDLVEVRRRVIAAARALDLGLLEQTKLVTAASELTRNMLQYAKCGRMLLEAVDEPARRGVRLVFEDEGPGIADLERAMQDGYSTGKGMGLGLPGTRRLAHEFTIETAPGHGTRVIIVMWKR
ncbi:anti-sigma B factor RsbT [Rhodovastum atsumiense]|uniref:Anti-sigma regulatory factor n=1 Tax=Rhodovastum atsumiense TaxID=504468 RepID=A0A5M6J014_9PROT|nr:anti-sigma regulatory factor [Rhodovastum atsumiense]KAA5613936.1 anti-sigma regulatory factor [Rhodovastum atsumiense]CAH2602051.1 anti-sigma B factor RsbT [Rhodovastum atsumiense]